LGAGVIDTSHGPWPSFSAGPFFLAIRTTRQGRDTRGHGTLLAIGVRLWPKEFGSQPQALYLRVPFSSTDCHFGTQRFRW